MGLVVPGLCAYGVWGILNVERITESTIQDHLMKYWREHGHAPHYMSLTETEMV